MSAGIYTDSNINRVSYNFQGEKKPRLTNKSQFEGIIDKEKQQFPKLSQREKNIQEKPSIDILEIADRLIARGGESSFKKFDKDTITYELNHVPDEKKEAVREAFSKWNDLIALEIKEASYFEYGDIVVNVTDLSSIGIEGIALEESIDWTENLLTKITAGSAAGAVVGATVGGIVDDYGAFFGAGIGSVIGGVGGALTSVGKNLYKLATGKETQRVIYLSESSAEFYYAVNHEIGHAIIGLKHPSKYGEKEPTYELYAEFNEDTRQYSVMSYNHETNGDNIANYEGQYPSTPMLADIIAAQKIYGANKETRTGNDIYKFEPKFIKGFISGFSEEKFDKDITNSKIKVVIPDHYSNENAPNSVVSIYDVGGEDTIDSSAFDASKSIKTKIINGKETKQIMTFRENANQTISLEPGTYSSIGYLKENVGIAHNTIIENAISANGNDILVGNKVNNYLESQDGDDVVDMSAGGKDIAYDGKGNDFYVLDVDKDFTTSDDILIFNYDENKREYFGDDVIYFFNPKVDEIIIAGAKEGHEVFLTQDGADTFIDYGSGTIRLKNINANEVKNAFKTTIAIVK